MKHFALKDGKFYQLRDGDYHPPPLPDVLEIFEAAARVVETGTKALEEMNEHK